MSVRDIIVIGASAGGMEALARLVAGLPRDFQAAIFVTLHHPGGRDGFLPNFLSHRGPLPAAQAIDGEPIRYGRIYTAPSDYHLTLEDGHVLLSHGPKENLQRPCINALFRSAAAAYGSRVTGILLSGLLDDGAAGLWEIQRHGGTTIVQDPEEAQFRSMPDSAIKGLNVQYIVGVAEIGPLLKRLTTENGQSIPESYPEPDSERSAQSCPSCGGAMTVSRLGAMHEFRCHIGHRFGLKTLIVEKRNVIEESLNSALAQSEELTGLLNLAIAESDDPEELDELHSELAERKSKQEALRALAGTQKTVCLEQ